MEIIILYFRAIYFGAYDTAKSMFDNPSILTKFGIAQVKHLTYGQKIVVG